MEEQLQLSDEELAQIEASVANASAEQVVVPSLYEETKPTKLPTETYTEYNLRLTQWYKDAPQPELTQQQIADGASVQFVRTGISGEGEYRIVYPVGFTGSQTSSASGGSGSGTDVSLIETRTDAYGNVIGIYSDGTTKTLIQSGNKYKSTVDQDAYSILESTMNDFGLGELVPEIKKFMEAGLGANQAAVELRKTSAYIERFKGNEMRRQAGLNVLSEAEYLALEDSYSQTLRAFGLQNYFGTDRKVKTAAMSSLIGNDISAIEFRDRIDTVVTRVNSADPSIKKTLNSFYNITDEDLVKYFLNPTENLPKLQEKVTAAEIGAAALGQGLITDVERATALAKLGVNKQQANEGYSAISGVLPTATKLGGIYNEEGINYDQSLAEQEVFGQMESAKRKRLRLSEKEIGSFSGTSGRSNTSLSGQSLGSI